MKPSEILALPMQDNEDGAATVRDYLKALLAKLWEDGDGFSCKRLYETLFDAGLVEADYATADQLIADAIKEL